MLEDYFREKSFVIALFNFSLNLHYLPLLETGLLALYSGTEIQFSRD